LTARESDALVIGGGIIGLVCAYFLLECGRSVRILEMDQLGSGCSAGNCGLITPSHAAPLTAPGAVGSAMRSVFDPHAPLYVKPALRPSTLLWLLKFASKCNTRDMRTGTAARAALLNSSRRLYDSIVNSNGMACAWRTSGVLAVHRDAESMRAAETADEALHEFGVSSTSYVGDDLIELEPALRDGLYGGRLHSMDAQVRPELLVGEMARVVRERGASIEEACAVSGFVTGRRGVERVQTRDGSFRAAEFVLAAGAWTKSLASPLGLKIPIEPGKGYSITVDRGTPGPTRACILQERSVGVTPWPGGYRLGGTMEFSGFDSRLNRTRLVAILEAAVEYLRQSPRSLDETRTWCGWRPMTPDELPYIGRSPRHSNLAEILTGATPHVDPAPYRLDRS
jgi:D-amino-acid dehydrogenase